MFSRNVRDFSTIRRWGTLRTIQSQNVAEHSFYVALYARHLLNYVRPNIVNTINIGELMTWCIWHDAGETFSGDIPGPWKRRISVKERYDSAELQLIYERFPDQPSQEPRNKHSVGLVKIANLVDELMFVSIELSLGNHAVTSVRKESIIPRLRDAIKTYDLFIDNLMVINELILDSEDCAEGHGAWVSDPDWDNGFINPLRK